MQELVNFFHPTNNKFQSQTDVPARQRTFYFNRKSILENNGAKPRHRLQHFKGKWSLFVRRSLMLTISALI